MRSHPFMLPVFLLAGHLLPMASLQSGEPASEADVNFATEALKVFSDYDEEKLLKFVGERNPEFSDLRPYYGWFVYGVEPKQSVFLGHASQRKRYLHVECDISDRVSPGRDWNNYLLELRELDNRVFLSKISLPGRPVRVGQADMSPEDIAKAVYEHRESNPDAVTKVKVLCRENLADSDELKAYRCSLVVTRHVHDLMIPTYVDAVIYLIRSDTGFNGYAVHLLDYEMARIRSVEQGADAESTGR